MFFASKCRNCGAAENAALLICEFCGTMLREDRTLTLDEELEAFKQLVEAGDKLRGSSAVRRFFARSPDANEFVRGAFMPNHPETRKRWGYWLLEFIITEGSSDEYKEAPVGDVKQRLTDLLQRIKRESTIEGKSESAHLLSELGEALEERLAKRKAGKFEYYKRELMPFVGIFGILAGILLAIQLLVFCTDSNVSEGDRRRCRGQQEDCSRLCQIAVCMTVCDEGEQWACTILEELKNE